MNRAAVIAAVAVAVSLAWWVACEATGIEVRTGRLFVFFVVVLATGFAVDFVDGRARDARMAAGVAAGGAAGGVTIIVWTGVKMAGLEVESGTYVVMFAATFVVQWLALRRIRRRVSICKDR